MALASPNRVPAKVFAIQAVLKNMFQTWNMRLSDFSRCFISTIVVAVGEMGRSSSFCMTESETTSVLGIPCYGYGVYA